MSSVISATLAYLTTWFQSRHAMQLEILALRHQLAVYQNRVKRPPLKPADRFFWAWFSQLWSGWQYTLEFVQPRTVLAWQKKRFRDYWRRLSQSGKPGRPPISKEVRDLIRDMWRSNPTWGSPRLVGELGKLGITVAKSTVEKYHPRIRKPPSPHVAGLFKPTMSKKSSPVISSPCQPFNAEHSSCSSCWLTSADTLCISMSPNTQLRSGPPSISWRPSHGIQPRAISFGIGTRFTARRFRIELTTWALKR